MATNTNLSTAIKGPDQRVYVNADTTADARRYTQEAAVFDRYLTGYLANEGRFFMDALSKMGKNPVPIKGVGAIELENDAVAALVKYRNEHGGLEAIIASNGSSPGFESRVANLANSYQIPVNLAMEYVLAHEIAHACQGEVQGTEAETQCEAMLESAFTYLADRSTGSKRAGYQRLAEVARYRKSAQQGKPAEYKKAA